MPFTTTETVRQALTSSFDQLDALFLLPRVLLLRSPETTDSWSIATHLEHVSLANRFLLLTISKGCRKALQRSLSLPIPHDESDLSPLSAIAIPGAFHWPPPRHMIPTGAVPLEQIRSALASQRHDCLHLLDSIPAGIGRLCTISMSVHSLGRLDMYQWLHFLAQHSRYHLTLIDTLRSAQQ